MTNFRRSAEPRSGWVSTCTRPKSLLMRTTRSALSLLARAPARCSRLLEGARPLIQPHDERPQGTIDMLSGKLVEATNDDLGWELPNVDLTENFTDEDLETLQQASDDAGGILVFTNQKESMTVHDHVRFARRLAEYNRTEIEPHAVAAMSTVKVTPMRSVPSPRFARKSAKYVSSAPLAPNWKKKSAFVRASTASRESTGAGGSSGASIGGKSRAARAWWWWWPSS